VQYIINPGTDPALKNALVIGLRFELSWSNEAG
jgi:carbohydrate-selective porin OprB